MMPSVGDPIRLVGPFEPDMPEHSVIAKVKAVHEDGTVDVDMTEHGLTYKGNLVFVEDGSAPSYSFCERVARVGTHRHA